MSLITALTVTPSRLAALLDTMLVVGGQGSRSEIESLISPVARRRDADTEDAKVEELIREAHRIGFVTLENNGQRLLVTDDGVAAAADLRSWILPRLLSEDLATRISQDDFPQLLCWLLMQDPYRGLDWGQGPSTVGSTLTGEVASRDVLKNKSSFQQFLYWARFLGFATWVRTEQGTRVIPLPVPAIALLLGEDPLVPGFAATADAFVRQLGELCPVLDGGKLRERVEADAPARSYDLDSRVSATLGLALLVLQSQRRLELVFESDSRTTLALAPQGRGSGQFTHARVL